MDLRVRALSALLVACTTGPPAASAGDPDAGDSLEVRSNGVGSPAIDATTLEADAGDPMLGDALQDEAEFVLDLETLALLDALLVDPVELGTRDVERLSVLPWLDAAALSVLATAPPVHDLAELASVPGWDATLARRVAPFVRFAGSRVRTPARIVVSGSPSAVRGRLESPSATIAARYTDTVEPIVRGFVHAHRGGIEVAAGDLRLGHAQGLVAWTGETSGRAGAAIARRARGLVGSDSSTRLRTLRGAGIAVRLAATELTCGTGLGTVGRTTIATCKRRFGSATELACAVLREPSGTWGSGALTWASERRRFAFELAARQRLAVAACGGIRTGRLRLGVRLEDIPPGELPSLAGVTTTVRERGARTVRAAADYGIGGLGIDAGVAGERRGEGEARERWRTETALALRARYEEFGVEIRLDDRITRTDMWRGEAVSEVMVDASRVVLLRLDHALGVGWTCTGEVRSAVEATPDPARRGRGWSLRVARARGRWRPVLVGGVFHTDAGIGVGTLGAASGLGPIRLQGDGLHAVVGLRANGSHWTAAGGVRARWTAGAPSDVVARGSFSLRVP